MSSRPRVALVVARCGEEVYGGAERLALDLAVHLQQACRVEILTSCAREYSTWANAFEPGAGTIAGVATMRFAVDRPRDRDRFDALSARIAEDPSHAAPEPLAQWAAEQGPRALGLAAYLRERSAEYDAVYFVSYLYATTYAAIDAAAGKAILMPLAHDEWMLRLPMYDGVFAAADVLAFVSEEERALVERRFPKLQRPSATIGAGIDVPRRTDPQGFRKRFGIGDEPLLVYVGRVDPAKGTAELLRDFAILRGADARHHTLVLVGPIARSVPRAPGVLAIGAVDEQTKFDALAAAEAVVIPSQYESLSIAALEALALGTPIVVNGASDVLVGHCRRSNAGLWYANRDEFVEIFRSDLCGAREALGRRGRAYVDANYTWPHVTAAHLALIDGLRKRTFATNETR